MHITTLLIAALAVAAEAGPRKIGQKRSPQVSHHE